MEDEPTIEKATRVGVPENFAKTAEGEDDEENVDEHGYNKSGINQAAVNFLRKLQVLRPVTSQRHAPLS